MSHLEKAGWSRREFITKVGLAGTAAILGMATEAAGAEQRLETTTLKMIYDPEIPATCYAAQYVAEELLYAEGFKNVRYVKMVGGTETKTLASGQADISASFGAELLALNRQ